jgi:hypothetical protein
METNLLIIFGWLAAFSVILFVVDILGRRQERKQRSR